MLDRLIKLSLILLLIFFSLTFLHSRGTHDRITWEKWAVQTIDFGIINAYQMNSYQSYPPLSFIILNIVGKLSKTFNIELFGGVKISIAFFLFITTFCFFYFTRDIILSFYLHISLLLNSICLAYIDIYFAPFLIIALFSLNKKDYLTFSIFFSISIFIKWQPLIIIPYILLYITKLKLFNFKNYREIYSQLIIPPVLSIIILTATFSFDTIAKTLIEAGSHTILSGNALNFNWILTHFLRLLNPDYYGGFIDGRCHYIISTSLQEVFISRLLFIAFYLTTMFFFWNKKLSFENFILSAIFGYWSYYTFNIGVHENHLFMVNIMAILLYHLNSRYLILTACVILISNINMFMFYGIDGSGLPFKRAIGGLFDMALLFSILNLIFFVTFWLKYITPKKSNLHNG